ncbi:MAG: hypothetical protein NC123_07800 [Butyrivibrio sp.]|nr:hypothetical protein [Acetatifactor muris]MCM1559435.1 hypothetical protein [Butyrivibrio sp.]
MEKSRSFFALACLLAVVLAGCGQTGVRETVESTTISVDRNGGMIYYLTGEFDRDYYSLSELSAMTAAEVEEFNRDTGEEGAVAVEKVETLKEDESRILIVWRFDGYKSFNEFNEKFNKKFGSFFYGTVEEAFQQGYIKDALLKSTKDDSVKTEEQLKQEGTKKLIVTEGKAVIYCPAGVTYLSPGAVLNEDGSVDASAADGTVYILMK